MPGFDGTGPQGRGPRTGRQLGNCVNATAIGRGFGPRGRGFRRGFGWGYNRGPGRGFGRGYWDRYWDIDLTKEEKRKILEAEKQQLERELKELE